MPRKIEGCSAVAVMKDSTVSKSQNNTQWRKQMPASNLEIIF